MSRKVIFLRKLNESNNDNNGSVRYDLFKDDETGITYVIGYDEKGEQVFVGIEDKFNMPDDPENDDNEGDEEEEGPDITKKLSDEEIENALRKSNKINKGLPKSVLDRVDKHKMENWLNGADEDLSRTIDPEELIGKSEEEIQKIIEERIKQEMADDLRMSKKRFDELISTWEEDEMLDDIGKTAERVQKKVEKQVQELRDLKAREINKNVGSSSSATAVTMDIVERLINEITADFVEEDEDKQTLNKTNITMDMAFNDFNDPEEGIFAGTTEGDESIHKRSLIPMVAVFYDFSGSFYEEKVRAASRVRNELIKWAEQEENKKYHFTKDNIVEYWWNNQGPVEMVNGKLPARQGWGGNGANEKVIDKIRDLQFDNLVNESFNVIIISDQDCMQDYSSNAQIGGTLSLIYYNIDEADYKWWTQNGCGYGPYISAGGGTKTYLMRERD